MHQPATISPQAGSCPLCGAAMRFDPRYPRAVCPQCAAQARDSSGRLLDFYNEGLSGGFVALIRATGEPYPSHECFINGARCRADEARFGGIVIQVIEET